MTADFPPLEALSEERARELAGELGLTDDEYDAVVDTLGRTPSVSELGMYSVMWSEHCSYKSSRLHLATLPTDGPGVLVGPGENAGVVDLGDGMAVAFKIESHNHPSFVEPVQGAATGVGGILRDILTMGARPILTLDPLRFGHPDQDGQRHLIDGVVRGVGGYGNCVGVPNLGGEVDFDPAYAANPLVNVFALGVLPADRLQLAAAEQPGDLAVLLGSSTGRDGIGGASVLASATFGAEDDKRPTVQVGDPFAGKLLIECCLELYDRGLVAGIQDMGAAGIACSTAELASAADLGIEVDLDAVYLREPDLESWEILCSESQERMLALVRPDDLEAVEEVADRWGVAAAVIGEIVAGDRLTVSRDGAVVAELPASSLADDAPAYRRPVRRPGPPAGTGGVDPDEAVVPPADEGDLAGFCMRFLSDPVVASRRWVYQQYDQLVLSNTVLGPGSGDAGVVRLPGSQRGVAAATDGNGRWCAVDPREGTRRVVAEAHRNVACTGARPLASTNCLNFGSPERAEIMWQFTEAVAGMDEACRALEIPVTGGNVSFYNETRGAGGTQQAIHPTPVVGVVGVLEDAADAVGLAFTEPGQIVVELGGPARPGLAGSQLAHVLGLPLAGRLAPVDLAHEAALAGLLSEAARAGLLAAAHDVSGGGLLVTLVESCLPNRLGVTVSPNDELSVAQRLFSEAPGRVIAAVEPGAVDELGRLAGQRGVALARLGTVGGDRLAVSGVADLALEEVADAYETGLEGALEA